jgi:hypothetical protein
MSGEVFLKELFGSWCDEMFEVVRLEPMLVLWGQSFVLVDRSKVLSYIMSRPSASIANIALRLISSMNPPR